MRRVDARPAGPGFQAWSDRASVARQKLIEAWQAEREAAARENRPVAWRPSFNEALYKGLRQVFLFEAFHQKCAYCEVNHSDGYPVQVEHYRPKGGVTENREATEHKGYFWLAYEWWNLVPSCAHCNTNHTDPCGGPHPGKKNEFPVGGARVTEPSDNPALWPEELAVECAALLNPYFDTPEEHIDFEPTTGAAIPNSPRGKATIEVCDLNRPSLRDKRLSLRGHALLGMVFDLMGLKAMDDIVPPSAELSLWRKRIIWDYLQKMIACAGLPPVQHE